MIIPDASSCDELTNDQELDRSQHSPLSPLSSVDSGFTTALRQSDKPKDVIIKILLLDGQTKMARIEVVEDQSIAQVTVQLR